jgi:hypothetical protein
MMLAMFIFLMIILFGLNLAYTYESTQKNYIFDDYHF